MSSTEAGTQQATGAATAGNADLKLEVVVIPVSDVDRAKAFSARLGWRLDADFAFDNGFRVAQFTPPGSPCSVQFAAVMAVDAFSGEFERQRASRRGPPSAQRLKAVVATGALGMGYDKADLGSVVHHRAHGSVVAYYEQVGGAGRRVVRTGVLHLGPQRDRRVPGLFIEQAFPPRKTVARALAASERGAHVPELMTGGSPPFAAASRRRWLRSALTCAG